ncbi:MAG TPA: hypothetical protein VKS21_07870, partial [Spirochaetota bacterium]|nr:hypothetical protein [Spirochaetota bacterium]
IYGYHNFKGGDYAGSESIMVYGTASGEDALTDTSFANFRYETRAKFFLTSNILDLFQLRSLFNIANALDSLDSLGGGLTFNREGRLKFHTYLSYLHLLKTAAWDSHFSVKSGGFYFYIDYDFLLKPFSPLQELKGGIRIVKPVSERRWGTIALYLNGRGSTYRQNEERKYGWLASAGLLFPLSMKFIFGAGYNTDPTMAKLPLGNDNLMFFFRIEVGMNRNFSPSFTPVYREHFL